MTGTVLGIWAHPDDEAFVAGGLLADAARRGANVRCLHMTAGEAGQCAHGAITPARLAATRLAELSAALKRLGVDGPHVLGWPDGHLSHVPDRVGVERIRSELIAVDPEVVVTFGPDGFTGHPDHRLVSRWLSTAIADWGRHGVIVMHAAVPPAWAERVIPALEEFNVFWPGFPEVDGEDTAVEHLLDPDLLDRKVAALRAHASQMEPLFAAYGENFVRALAAVERFRLADVPADQPQIQRHAPDKPVVSLVRRPPRDPNAEDGSARLPL